MEPELSAPLYHILIGEVSVGEENAVAATITAQP
jgi:hypothetical protein